MNLIQFRELKWRTADNRDIKIKNLTNVHLVNIIHHCETSNHPNVPRYGKETVALLREEAYSRNITEDQIKLAPIPWQDEKGRWLRLNPDKCGYEEILP